MLHSPVMADNNCLATVILRLTESQSSTSFVQDINVLSTSTLGKFIHDILSQIQKSDEALYYHLYNTAFMSIQYGHLLKLNDAQLTLLFYSSFLYPLKVNDIAKTAKTAEAVVAPNSLNSFANYPVEPEYRIFYYKVREIISRHHLNFDGKNNAILPSTNDEFSLSQIITLSVLWNKIRYSKAFKAKSFNDQIAEFKRRIKNNDNKNFTTARNQPFLDFLEKNETNQNRLLSSYQAEDFQISADRTNEELYNPKAKVSLSKIEKYKTKFTNFFNQLKINMAQRKVDTIQVVKIYNKYTKGEASAKEIKFANKYLRKTCKELTICAVVPFAPITIPFLWKLESKFGIKILPKM